MRLVVGICGQLINTAYLTFCHSIIFQLLQQYFELAENLTKDCSNFHEKPSANASRALVLLLKRQWGALMDPIVTSLLVAAITFAGGVFGLVLQRFVPEKLASGALKDMTAAIGGLLSLLTALVLGLLIWTAYGVYSNQNTAVRNLAIGILQFDLALADYGPDASEGRTQLRKSVSEGIHQIWTDRTKGDFVSRNDMATLGNLRARQAFLNSLHPTTQAQKDALAAANQASASVTQTRLQMALALIDPVSRPLVFVVVSWATLIFVGFGFMHGGHLTTIIAIGVGAVAVAAAIYLVVDLSAPYSGFFRVSSAPIEEVLNEIDQSAAAGPKP
jgi:hypothetical protein